METEQDELEPKLEMEDRLEAVEKTEAREDESVELVESADRVVEMDGVGWCGWVEVGEGTWGTLNELGGGDEVNGPVWW